MTAILYANPEWTPAHGGQLRIWVPPTACNTATHGHSCSLEEARQHADYIQQDGQTLPTASLSSPLQADGTLAPQHETVICQDHNDCSHSAASHDRPDEAKFSGNTQQAEHISSYHNGWADPAASLQFVEDASSGRHRQQAEPRSESDANQCDIVPCLDQPDSLCMQELNMQQTACGTGSDE